MRTTAFRAILVCLALTSVTLICNAQTEPSLQQDSEIGGIRFHLMMQGKLGIRGGGSGDVCIAPL